MHKMINFNFNWKSLDEATPSKGILLIVTCEGWNGEGYQICKWNGKEFYYIDQPNDMFNDYITTWTYLEDDDSE